ncbi:hypothetical protein LJB90_03580, partial [Eubacteriales bacterium OttesenSCG-928-G02]|nr:hypothetical protein [Eubacteriales bacterium OttesenSCG-928-G02]
MKRFISLLTLILILSVTFVSCQKTSGDESTVSSTQSEGSASSKEDDTSEEPTYYGENLPVKDMDGRVFRVLCKDFSAGTTSILGYNGEIIQRDDYDELTAGIVDVAKRETRVKIEDRYNCKIEGLITSANANNDTFNNIVKS